jgi:hypothetical protein
MTFEGHASSASQAALTKRSMGQDMTSTRVITSKKFIVETQGDMKNGFSVNLA